MVTIGTFDGVHIGHKKIIERIIASANNAQYESLILTFFPHPRMVLGGQPDIKLLNTLDEKKQLLAQTGLDSLVIHPFDADFSQLSAEEFVKNVLVDTFGTAKIIIGHDHRFGKNRAANIDDLIVFGAKYGFEVEQITAQEIDDVSVSSTKIRTALTSGNVALANSYLGYNYMFSGKVVKGQQLGRTIGFPTANIEINDPFKVIPHDGVYIVKADRHTFGMMNIGNRPTLHGLNRTIEVHLLDFDRDLYDKTLEISVVERLRDEQKFDSVDFLVSQLKKDLEATRRFIANL